MSRILVTVRGSSRTVDLEAPADIPVQELIPALLGICEEMTPETIALHATRWVLGLEGGLPFHPQQTLASAGALDGAILLLHPFETSYSGSAPSATAHGTPTPAQQPASAPMGHGLTVRWGNAPQL